MRLQDHSMAHRCVLEAPVGAVAALPRAGTALENDLVFDAVARDLKQEADSGFMGLEIVDEAVSDDSDQALITRLTFRRRY